MATITGVYHAGYQKFYDKTDVGFVAKKDFSKSDQKELSETLKEWYKDSGIVSRIEKEVIKMKVTKLVVTVRFKKMELTICFNHKSHGTGSDKFRKILHHIEASALDG